MICQKSQSFPGAEHVFFAKIQNGRQRLQKNVTYEEFDIYSFVIPLFHLIFHVELIPDRLFRI